MLCLAVYVLIVVNTAYSCVHNRPVTYPTHATHTKLDSFITGPPVA